MYITSVSLTLYIIIIYIIMMLREERKKGESTEISMNKQDVMNRLYGYYTRLTA